MKGAEIPAETPATGSGEMPGIATRAAERINETDYTGSAVQIAACRAANTAKLRPGLALTQPTRVMAPDPGTGSAFRTAAMP